MSRRAILHIGTEKTGTTALQLAFHRDAERLATSGVRYPDFRMPNHAALVFAAADDEEMVRDLGVHVGLMPGETREDLTTRLHGWLKAETTAYPDARFVLSTEHAQSRLNSIASVERVRSILSAYFDEIDIVVYLRRWDRMALSFHAGYWYVLAELLHDLDHADGAREAVGEALAIEPHNEDFLRFAAALGDQGSGLCGAGEEINR